MHYEIYIEKAAQKSLSKIPTKDQNRIVESIQRLSDNPRLNNSKKLSGRNGWRIRIGNYRVIYEIQDEKLLVLVVVIGHRSNVYHK